VANNVACPPGSNKGSRRSDFNKLQFTSWNIGTLMGKFIKLVKVLHTCKINIVCVQETKWVGVKAKKIDEYKLWYSRLNKAKNGEAFWSGEICKLLRCGVRATALCLLSW